MEDNCEKIYNSQHFSINRERFLKQGKTKEDILDIIKNHLININKTYDIQNIIKSQIIELLNEQYNGNLGEAIHNVFKIYYIEQPKKLKSHLTLFKEYCEKNSNVRIEELITTLFMNVEQRSIDNISKGLTDYVKNEFQQSQNRNDKAYTEYFKKTEFTHNKIQESLNISKKDILDLEHSYKKLDQFIKKQTKSNIDLINHIVNDRISKNNVQLKNKDLENTINYIQRKLKNLENQIEEQSQNESESNEIKDFNKDLIQSMIDESIQKYHKTIEDSFNKINQLEKEIEILKETHFKEKQSLNDRMKKFCVLNEKFKLHIKKLIDNMNKTQKANSLNINKMNDKLIELNHSLKESKDIEKRVKLNENTIKSMSTQYVKQQSNLFQEIDNKIDEKFRYHHTNEHISQIQCEIIKLRAEIDLIYRNRQQTNDFYGGYAI